MNEMQVIEQRELFGKDFKIYGDFENPLFLARDVAEWIDYAKREDGSYQVGQMLRTIDDTEKISTVNSLNGKESWFLTEEGLYEVLLQSRKPIAKQFKIKVKEILKDIRKHGLYATTETIENLLNNPETMIVVLTKYKEEREKREQLEKQVEEQRPKVVFADAVSTSKTSILVGELAKILKQNSIDIGQNRMFEWLRVKGYLINRKGTDYNMPTQYSMKLELFEIKETCVAHSDGHTTIKKTPKVTGKGQVYFVNKFKSQLEIDKPNNDIETGRAY